MDNERLIQLAGIEPASTLEEGADNSPLKPLKAAIDKAIVHYTTIYKSNSGKSAEEAKKQAIDNIKQYMLAAVSA